MNIPHPPTQARPTGFTLVEILIVVVILGILAAIVVASIGDAATPARQNAFVTNLKTFARAANVFIAEQSALPPDTSSGTLTYTGPQDYDLTTYFKEEMWVQRTPIGGRWDIERDLDGQPCALGVHFDGETPPSDEFMAEIDLIIDDGDLTTGSFRKFAADRFYMIIMPG